MTRDEAIAQGKMALDQAQSDALGGAYDAGLASAPVAAPGMPSDNSEVVDTTPYDEAAMAAAVSKAKEEQMAVDADVLAKAKTDMQAQIDELGLKLKQKDADALEEAIADKLDALAKELRDRTVPVSPSPAPIDLPADGGVVPPVEAPVEEPATGGEVIEPGTPDQNAQS